MDPELSLEVDNGISRRCCLISKSHGDTLSARAPEVVHKYDDYQRASSTINPGESNCSSVIVSQMTPTLKKSITLMTLHADGLE